jgi:hypothetical protein
VDFVVGHPRSGTALLSAILDGEHEWLAKLTGESIAAPSEYYEGRRSRESIVALLDRYRSDGRPVRIDSNWKLTWILDVVLETFPDARVLHLAREPVANVTACVSLDFYGDPARRLADLPVRNQWLDAMPRIRHDGWDTFSQLEKNCAFWAETHRLIFAATASHPRVMRLRLEELDVAAAQRVRAFFGRPRVDDQRIAAILDERHNDRVAIRARLAAEGAPTALPIDARAAFDSLTVEIAGALGYPSL